MAGSRPSTPDEALVIPLRVSTRDRHRWTAISVLLPMGVVVAFVVAPSWEVGIWGGLLIGSFALVWILTYAGRRVRRGAPMQIVATTTGISLPFCSLDWDRVRRIRLVYLSASGLPALLIDPMRPADVRWANSAFARLNGRLSSVTKQAPIRILQANVDLPLGQLATELEARAGRPLLGQP